MEPRSVYPSFSKISKDKLKKIWQSRLAKEEVVEEFSPKIYIAAFLIVNIVVILAVVLLSKSSRLPPQVPLLYGLPEGEAQLAERLFLVSPTIVSLGVILLNASIMLFLKDNFLKKVLTLTFVATSFFSTVTVAKIIFLVGV